MRLFVYLAAFLLISCDQNPFGESSSSSCDHSPNEQTGLPLVCQVSLGDTDGLVLWIDINETSSLILESPEVTGIIDKSGTGNSFNFLAGNRARLVNASTNERDSLVFGPGVGDYGRVSDFNSAIAAGSSVSAFFVFEIKSLADDNILLTSNADFKFEVNSSGEYEYQVGSSGLQTITVQPLNRLIKISMIYNALDAKVQIFENGILVGEANANPGSSLWSSFLARASASSELMEVLIYSESKATVERQEIETYLNNKWGF